MSEPQDETDQTAERFAHLVLESAEERAAALADGTPVGSACGKVWVPSREPDRFALCPACVEHVRLGWMA